MEPQEPIDYDQPVAYDVQGKPLYAHPPAHSPSQPTNNSVHVSRPVDPGKTVVSDEMKARHDESVRLYPALNLSETEYVISAVRKHPIALLGPVALGVLLIGLAIASLFNYDILIRMFNLDPNSNAGSVVLPVLILCGVIAGVVYLAYFIYANNMFYLTNESVIQCIQLTVFARQEQTVSLGNVEDASFTQRGIFQYMFNYGSIRLSTQGDENTYRFSFVSNPKYEIATLNNAVESFKNGRRVGE
jgi:hypothetical protein